MIRLAVMLYIRFPLSLRNGEIFYSLREAQILIEEWRKHYNTKRPHSALGYRPPAPETIIPMECSGAAQALQRKNNQSRNL